MYSSAQLDLVTTQVLCVGFKNYYSSVCDVYLYDQRCEVQRIILWSMFSPSSVIWLLGTNSGLRLMCWASAASVEPSLFRKKKWFQGN